MLKVATAAKIIDNWFRNRSDEHSLPQLSFLFGLNFFS